MIQVSTVVDTSKEVEKQTNKFFKENKDRIKYVDIKYISLSSGYYSVMIIYELLENDTNTLKLWYHSNQPKI